MDAKEKKNILETVKKSSLNVKDIYDYKKLELPKKHFIDIEMEIDKEDIRFYYDCSNLLESKNLKKEDLLTKLRFLISISELEELIYEYEFSLSPENLYYGRDDQVKVKVRDVKINKEDNNFLNEYKALIGHVWQSKYSYEDYLKGGMELLSKEKFLKKILEVNSVEEIINILNCKFEEVKLDRQENKVIIDKKKYKNNKTFLIISVGLLLIIGIYISYMHIKILPFERAASRSSEAYIRQDYVGVIDLLKNIKVKDMDKIQKFILADAYIRSENLSEKQRENIFKNISLDSNDEILEYWIYLGRNELENSVNIAMKLSDDELLLYAYMKQLDKLEKNTTMDGKEKSAQMKEIKQNMDSLLEKYNDGEEE